MNLTFTDIQRISITSVLDAPRERMRPFTGVSTDSRTTQPGNLFIALRGERFDGHDFLTKAVARGAVCVVVEKRWVDANGTLCASLTVPKVVVADTTVALGEIARVYRRKFELPILAIGGSNGKTTTKEMIAAVLRTKYNVLATEGNLNNHIGVPQMLLRLDAKHDVAVIEMGTNHPGEITHLCTITEPTHGLMTNIGREHLEFFGSLRGVAKAEGELFEWLRKQSPRSLLFVNADDPLVVELAKGHARVVRFGMRSRRADVVGRVEGMSDAACATLSIRAKRRKPFIVELRVPGMHNAQNALAAVAVGLSFRVPVKNIQEALASFAAASKRMEVLSVDGITILNDTYNSNPDSVLVALQTLQAMTVRGKRIAVLADMLELGERAEQEHTAIGKVVATYGVEYLLTYGPLSRFTHDAAKTQFKAHYDQKNMLAEYLAELLTEGDVVLVKGSRGMKMEDIVTFLKERFSKAA